MLQRIRDFAAWLEPQGVRIHNCWMTRQGIDAPHSFAYKRRHGLMDQELLVVTTAGDVHGHDEDVFCVVKHRMHNLHPNSCPSLVLPRQRYLAVPTRAPAQWEAPTPFKGDRGHKLLAARHHTRADDGGLGPAFAILTSCRGSAGLGPRP